MKKGSNTRSGLLWEIERILQELPKDKLPQILLMENVPPVITSSGWHEWNLFLEKMGYNNYCELLNAKNYYIPQNRDRAFMVSILGEYSYTFPQPMKLELRLKDFLEDYVDEKYYLSQQQIDRISNWKAQQDPLKNIEKEKVISPCSNARGAGEEHSGMILINETTMCDYNSSDNFMKGKNRVFKTDIAPTLLAREKFEVVEETICLNSKVNGKQPSLQDRIYDTNGCSTAITTSFMPNIVVGINDVVIVKGNYSPSNHSASIIIDPIEIAPIVMENHGTVTAIEQNLRIRKLTERECFRLMGLKDYDIDKITAPKTHKYKQAGNSIVISVLMAIFGELLEIDWQEKIIETYGEYKK